MNHAINIIEIPYKIEGKIFTWLYSVFELQELSRVVRTQFAKISTSIFHLYSNLQPQFAPHTYVGTRISPLLYKS